MHPYLENLKEYPARSRLHVVLSNPQAAAETARMVGPDFLKVFPSHERLHVSDIMGHPFSGTPVVMDNRPPESMSTLGPYPVLEGMDMQDRADFVLSNTADFEDFFREIPEMLLLLPQERREDVANGLGITPPEEFLHDAEDEVVADSTVETPSGTDEPVEGRFGKLAADGYDEEEPAANVVLEGNLKRFMDDSVTGLVRYVKERLAGDESQQEKEDLWEQLLSYYSSLYIVHMQDLAGNDTSAAYKVFPNSMSAWDGQLPYKLKGDRVEYLHLYRPSGTSAEDIPLEIVTKLVVEYHSVDTASNLPVRRTYKVVMDPKKPKKVKSLAVKKEKAEEPQQYTAQQIYSMLTTPIAGAPPIGEMLCRGVKHPLSVGDFPDGMLNDHGDPMKFGEGPEGYVRVMQHPGMNVVDIKLDDITHFDVGPGLEMETASATSELSNKHPEDVEYIEMYDASIKDLRERLKSTIIAVIDTETVGFVDKLLSDSGVDKRRSVGQLLQIAGVKIREDSGNSTAADLDLTGGFKIIGDIFNKHIRLVPHNLAVLKRESEEGFGERVGNNAGSVKKKMTSGALVNMPAEKDHDDILHGALQYVHREYNPRKATHGSDEPTRLDVDILGVPRSHQYGIRVIKEKDEPTRLSPAQLQHAQSREAQSFVKQHDALRDFLKWLRNVNVVCGQNVYMFDRKYLNIVTDNLRDALHTSDRAVAEEVSKDIQRLNNITYLDTLHIVKIMFLPAISILAFQNTPDFPEADKKEAQAIANVLKSNAKLITMATALDVPLSGAHDALNDVNATVSVLMRLVGKMIKWESHLVDSARYKQTRYAQKIAVARMFPNRVKTTKVSKGRPRKKKKS